MVSVKGAYVGWWEHVRVAECSDGSNVVSHSADYLYSTAASLGAAGWTREGRMGLISDSPMTKTVSICQFYMGFYLYQGRKLSTCHHRYEKGYNDGSCGGRTDYGVGVKKGWVWASIADCESDTGFCGYCVEIYLFKYGADHQYRRDGFSPGPQFPNEPPKYVILSENKPNEATCPVIEPCRENIAYNIQFIIDESESVNKNNAENYGNSIDFVIDLIENDVSENSKISAMAFSSINDKIYSFDDEQNDNRNGIITTLESEKMDYAGKETNTYDALIGGLEEFKNTPSLDGNILLLITDGKPTSGILNICDEMELLNDLNSNNIRIITIGITSSFDENQLKCLSHSNDIFIIEDFTSQHFEKLEQDIRDILCPSVGNIEFIAPNNENNHNNDNNKNVINVEFIALNAFISAISCLSVITLCLSIFYCISRAQKTKYTKVQS